MMRPGVTVEEIDWLNKTYKWELVMETRICMGHEWNSFTCIHCLTLACILTDRWSQIGLSMIDMLVLNVSNNCGISVINCR